MGISNVEITHNFTGETGYVIIVPKKTTAPLADVICTIDGVVGQTRKVYTAPHSQESMLVEDLDPVWYFFTAYRSADGVALDEQINIIAVNAKSGAVYGITKIEYKVDRGDPGDPVSDTSSLRDPRLLNATYWIEERLTGIIADEEITDRSDDGGGFDFTDSGKTFNADVYYWAFILNKTDVTGDTTTTVLATTGIVLMSDVDGVDFDPLTMAGKTLVANWGITVGDLAIPNLAAVPNCSFKINTHQGSQRNVIMTLDAGDLIWFNGEQVNQIVFGKGEEAEFAIIDNVMYVLSADTGHKVLGEMKYAARLLINTAYANGAQFNQSDYPRVVELMDALEAGAVVSYTTWNADVIVSSVNYGKVNMKKWARDDVSDPKTFKFPDLRDNAVRGLRYVDGTVDAKRQTQGPGGSQKNISGPVRTFIWTGNPVNKNGINADVVGIQATMGDGGSLTPTAQIGTNRSTARAVTFGDGTETIMENAGFYLLICI